VSGIPVAVCSACGRAVFPARLLCPRCGANSWHSEDVDQGVVEEVTLLRRAPGGKLAEPVPLGTVQLDGDVLVVARLEPTMEPGAPVRLEYRDGVPVASPAEP
jgi:uncharacterized OB-fold protein